jgi:hypothetical protein
VEQFVILILCLILIIFFKTSPLNARKTETILPPQSTRIKIENNFSLQSWLVNGNLTICRAKRVICCSFDRLVLVKRSDAAASCWNSKVNNKRIKFLEGILNWIKIFHFRA